MKYFPKIKFIKTTYKHFEAEYPLNGIRFSDKRCHICDKQLDLETAYFVYYIGLMCGALECDTMLLLQYAEYIT